VSRDEEAWLASDARISAALLAAGWRRTDRAEAFGITDLEYDNGSMLLYVAHEILKSELSLTFAAEEGEARIIVEFDDDADYLVNLLRSWQSKITSDNFRDLAEAIVRRYPNTFAMTESGRKRVHPRDST
jgi:hypothetical protein